MVEDIEQIINIVSRLFYWIILTINDYNYTEEIHEDISANHALWLNYEYANLFY